MMKNVVIVLGVAAVVGIGIQKVAEKLYDDIIDQFNYTGEPAVDENGEDL